MEAPWPLPTPEEVEFIHQVFAGHLRTHKWATEMTESGGLDTANSSSRQDPDLSVNHSGNLTQKHKSGMRERVRGLGSDSGSAPC